MTIQKRPLSGMVIAGVAAPRPVSNTGPTTLHTLDQTASQQGGPYPGLIDLWVSNPTGGDLNVSVIVAGGTPFLVKVTTLTTLKVLDGAVFQAAASPGVATVTGQGSGAGLVFWGEFANPL